MPRLLPSCGIRSRKAPWLLVTGCLPLARSLSGGAWPWPPPQRRSPRSAKKAWSARFPAWAPSLAAANQRPDVPWPSHRPPPRARPRAAGAAHRPEAGTRPDRRRSHGRRGRRRPGRAVDAPRRDRDRGGDDVALPARRRQGRPAAEDDGCGVRRVPLPGPSPRRLEGPARARRADPLGDVPTPPLASSGIVSNPAAADRPRARLRRVGAQRSRWARSRPVHDAHDPHHARQLRARHRREPRTRGGRRSGQRLEQRRMAGYSGPAMRSIVEAAASPSSNASPPPTTTSTWRTSSSSGCSACSTASPHSSMAAPDQGQTDGPPRRPRARLQPVTLRPYEWR